MIKIKVKFSFLLFNALIFMFRDSNLILSFYIACISHEIGHILALYITGGELRSIEFSCFGIRIITSPYQSIKSGIFVLLSGVAVNFMMYGFLALSGKNGLLAQFSLAEGIFNLLPYSMLDGGAVLNLIAEGNIYEKQLKVVYAAVRVIVAIIIVFLIIKK